MNEMTSDTNATGIPTGKLGMWVFLASWRKTESFTKFSKVANVALMSAGVLLLLMQLHGYQHSRFTDDFPLNKDEHFHIHSEMEANRDIGTENGAK